MGLLSKLFKGKTEEKAINVIGHDHLSGSIIAGSMGFEFDGFYTDNKLIEEGYVSNTDVYAIIKKICEVSSCIPFIVEEWDGEEWVETESSLSKLLEDPNEDISGKEFRFNSMLYLLNTGDLFWRKTTSSFNLVTELRILESNLTELNLDVNNNLINYLYDNLNTTQSEIPQDEVDHIKFYNPSYGGQVNKRGLSPLQAAYNSLQASNNRLIAQANIFENRGATNIISSGSDLSVGAKERDELQKNSDKILGGAKTFNKSIVTTSNVKVMPLGMSPSDLKLVESQGQLRDDICNVLGVPSTMFNNSAASTESNVKTDLKKFYNDAIIPYNDRLISYFNRFIVPAYSSFENKELRIRQYTNDIEALQEDKLLHAQKTQTEISTLLSIADNQSLSEDQKTELYNRLGYEL